ncbi:MAG: hypothetical protein ACFFDR_05345 [Candidatus Thorarchaeota archaeon]
MSSSIDFTGNPILAIFKSIPSRFIKSRRHLRSTINSNKTVDRNLHIFSNSVLAVNILLIVYALLSITARNLLSNVPLLDSLPLAFYILPLMIILPKILFDLYRSRSAFLSMLILAVSAIIFGLISNLVRGFVILVVVNIISCVFIFVMGRFRPTQPIRSIGKKGLAWFLLMNVLGLMMPVSVVVMGQTPIAVVEADHSVPLFVEMPLSDFGTGYQAILPNSDLIDKLLAANIGIDIRYPSNDTSKLGALETWMLVLDSNSVPFRLTITSDRDKIETWIEEAGFTDTMVFDVMESQYRNVLQDISNLTATYGMNTSSIPVYFDMTLSEKAWQSMMTHVRSVDLPRFSEYIRNETDAIATLSLMESYESLTLVSEILGFETGFIVDGFAIDDIIDNDSVVARFNGFSTEILQANTLNLEVSCSRTQYSEVMEGDVGEYLSYTYSLSSETDSIRLGVAGNNSGSSILADPVYEDISILVNDIAIASGNGVTQIVISSLPSILSSFGEDGLALLRSEFEKVDEAIVTYTFRIYAFRAVMMAIDSFDFIML